MNKEEIDAVCEAAERMVSAFVPKGQLEHNAKMEISESVIRHLAKVLSEVAGNPKVSSGDVHYAATRIARAIEEINDNI